MDDEERQRTMDFILRQQAQFTVGMQKLEEQQAQFSGELKSVRRVVVLLARQFRRERGDLRERIAALVDAQIRSEERLSRSDARLNRLEDITERNSKDIAALTQTVEFNSDDIRALLLVTEHNSDAIRQNSEAIRALTAATERDREAIRELVVATDRNREDIAALAKVVSDLAHRRNGDDSA
jgi:chromosome segregation ATPase